MHDGLIERRGGLPGPISAWTRAEPPGAPCTIVEGRIPTTPRTPATPPGSATDIDPDTGIGTCIEMCVATHRVRQLSHHGLRLPLFGYGCFPGCSPAAIPARSCPIDETCVAAYEAGFICFPPAAEGITGESCECANAAPTRMCTDAASYGPDCAYALLHRVVRHQRPAFTCAGPDQQCVALFEPTDPSTPTSAPAWCRERQQHLPRQPPPTPPP